MQFLGGLIVGASFGLIIISLLTAADDEERSKKQDDGSSEGFMKVIKGGEEKKEQGIYKNTIARMRKLGIYNEHDAIAYLSQEIDVYRERIKHIEQERQQPATRQWQQDVRRRTKGA